MILRVFVFLTHKYIVPFFLNHILAKAMTSCSFNDDFQSCVFAQEADSEVNWTLSSYVSTTFQ